jgi:hypothetical protein
MEGSEFELCDVGTWDDGEVHVAVEQRHEHAVEDLAGTGGIQSLHAHGHEQQILVEVPLRQEGAATVVGREHHDGTNFPGVVCNPEDIAALCRCSSDASGVAALQPSRGAGDRSSSRTCISVGLGGGHVGGWTDERVSLCGSFTAAPKTNYATVAPFVNDLHRHLKTGHLSSEIRLR